MEVKRAKMFEAITVLRGCLSEESQLEVFHGDYRWFASFQWRPTTTDVVIEELHLQLGITLPKDYCLFLTSVSNGATLFHDSVYGQWGYKIYSAEELYKKRERWKRSIPTSWQPNFLAFAELFGEANLLLFDLARPSSDKDGCSILEGSAYDPVEYWPIASESFHEWLDHLITAQGDKYWLWR